MAKILGWMAAAAVLAVAVAFFVIQTFNDSVTDHMVQVANRIEVPVKWAMLSEHITGEQIMCIGSTQCPSLSRRWQTDKELTPADLKQIAAVADLQFRVDGDCTRRENVLGITRVCSGTAVVEGYDISLSVDSPRPGADSLLKLNLEPSGS